jgi:outer membrane biosynthesis protein TonB
MQFPLILSIVIHIVVVILATFGLPFLTRDYETVETPIIVELVEVAEITQATSSSRAKPDKPKTPEPKEDKPAPPKEEPKPPPPPTPAPPPPPPTPAPPKEEPKPAPPAPTPPPPPPEPAKEAAKVDEPKPPVPKPPAKPAPPKPEAKKEDPKPTPPKKREEPDDPFKSLMSSVDAMRQDTSKEDPKAKETAPKPTTGAASPVQNAPIGDRATMSEKDAIRAQIEQHWFIDPGALNLENMVVTLQVRINPDGSVVDAQIMDRARYASDSHFRSVAEGARRAAYKASPLKYPTQKYNEFKVMEVVFRPEGRL